MQAGLRKEFLDLIQRLSSEVWRLQHFCLGLLHQFAHVIDPVVFQAIRRSDRQFEFVDPFEQFVGLAGQKLGVRLWL